MDNTSARKTSRTAIYSNKKIIATITSAKSIIQKKGTVKVV